jgi:hypothetical protein
VAGGVGGDHRGAAAADLVDVGDLPGGVVEERARAHLHGEVVVVLAAAHERAEGGPVAHGEAEAVGEEADRRFVIDRRDRDVATA